MIGLTFDKLLVIAAIAVFLIGPQRLPAVAASVGRFARGFRKVAEGARDRVREEMGEEFDTVDWKQLDPRQYDPRRIIRDALLDDLIPGERAGSTEPKINAPAEPAATKNE